MADQVLVDAVPRIDLTNLIEELKTKNRENDDATFKHLLINLHKLDPEVMQMLADL